MPLPMVSAAGKGMGCASFTFTERVEGVGGEKKKPLAARLV